MPGKKGGDNEQKHLPRRPFRLPWRCGGAIPHASLDEGGPGLS
jgi:hypothetical protein